MIKSNLANKTALSVALLFILLLVITSGIYLHFTSHQFISFVEVQQNQTISNRETIVDAIALQNTLKKQLSISSSEIVNHFNQLSIEHEHYPNFIILIAENNGKIATSNRAQLTNNDYNLIEDTLTISSANEEIEIFLADLSAVKLNELYILLVIPFSEHPDEDLIERFQLDLSQMVLLVFGLILLIGVLLIWLIIRRTLKPLKELNVATSSISSGIYPEALVVTGTDEIAELTKNFNHAMQHLKQKEALRKQSLTDVSHELRTPLTNMIGKIDAWRDGLIQDKRLVQSILMQEISQLILLVNDLQDLALARVGELTLYPESIKLHDAIENIIDSNQFTYASRNPVFDNQIADDIYLYADRARLKQIISNLVVNAVKHNPKSIKIAFLLEVNDSWSVLTITDTGQGIQEQYIKEIFNRNVSFSDTDKGLGLGLAIVKNLMLLHHGKITVSSKPGDTQFNLHFPVESNKDTAPL